MHLFVADSCHARCRRDGPRESLHHFLDTLMPGVNLAFFSLAGASLKLDALGQATWLAAVVCAFRVVAIFVGSHAGCWLSGCASEHKKRMWQAMMTQVLCKAMQRFET